MDRRRLLVCLAAGSATVASATGAALALMPAPAGALAPDPVFAAIEAHRAAYAAWDVALTACNAIEEREDGIEWAPEERRRACGYFQAREHAGRLDKVEQEAFAALCDLTPTTLAGTAALAAHAHGSEAECHGYEGKEWAFEAVARALAVLSPAIV